MPRYRVSFSGYMEEDFSSPQDAEDSFTLWITGDKLDQYFRNWRDLIEVERFDEATGEWVREA